MPFYLLPSGNCPICKTKLKVETNERISYKSRFVNIYKSEGMIETKCPKCKSFIVDKR